jgi:hypothetical protein
MTLPSECKRVAFFPVTDGTYRCPRCLMIADRQPDGSLLARGQIKSVNVSITIGGVKAPEGPLLYRDSHVPLAYETKERESKCEKCADPIFWYGGKWLNAFSERYGDAVCHATPEQKAAPLAVVKACDHRAGVVMSNGEARCAGCHQLVGTVIQNQERLYEQGAEMLRHAGQYPDKVLAELLAADPLTTALSAEVARRLVTPRDPFPLPPPEYGVDMSPYLKTPGFGKALKDALSQVLPPSIPVDEAFAAMGYVSKDKAITQAEFQKMQNLAHERGDKLQIVEDEIRAVKAENSDLRRKVERLERRK